MILLSPKILIVVTLYLFLITIGVIFGVKPLLVGVQDRQANLQIEYDKYRKADTKLSQLSKLSQSKNSIDIAKIIADTAIPETLEQDKLILTLEKTVADLNLGLSSLSTTQTAVATPAKPAVVDASIGSSIQASIGVTGPYNTIVTLVDSLENIDRVMVISSVVITASDKSNPENLSATIMLNAYGRSDKL